MCLIAVGTCEDIKKIGLGKAWRTNPDGAGIIIPANRPIVRKGIMSLDHLKKVLDHIPNDRTIALHLRLATHGKADETNTHPFRLNRYSYLMHNGILNGLGSSGPKGESDSAELARILSAVKMIDRKKLLDLIPGKFLYVNGNCISTHGTFEKHRSCLVSNTYWDTPVRMYYSGGKAACATLPERSRAIDKPYPMNDEDQKCLDRPSYSDLGIPTIDDWDSYND